MLFVTNSNQTEAILESNYEKHEEQNGAAMQISFSSFSFPQNVGHGLLDYEVFVEDEDGHEYKVKQYQQNGPEKRITATHIYYELGGHYLYDIYGGTRTFNDFALGLFLGTGWTFQNIDVTGSQIIADFGGNNVLQLIKLLCSAFDCEYQILPGKIIRFAKIIGKDNDLQYRYKHNINDLTQSIDTTSLKTQIRGYGADGLVVTYTSPLASHPRIGVRVAEPFYDDSITTQAEMTKVLQPQLPDAPETVVEVSVTQVDGDVGDYVWIIHEELDLLYQTRILAKKTKRNYVDSMVTVGNTMRKDLTDILISQKAAIEENKKVTRSRFEQTNDRITMEVETLGESIAAVNVKADNINLSVNNRITSEMAAINIRADKIELSVENIDEELSSRITQTASQIRLEVSSEVTTIKNNLKTTNNNVASLQIQADQISSTVSSQSTQISSLGTRVSSAESSITQQANQIALKVSQTDFNGSTIMSKINLDSSSVTIDARKINLNGAVMVNGTISGSTSMDITNDIFVGNNIYLGYRNSGNKSIRFNSSANIYSSNNTDITVSAQYFSVPDGDIILGNYSSNIYLNGNIVGDIAKGHTPGIGIAFSSASKRLYVRLNGYDVGYVTLN
ncbi:phage tail protein [Lysinibacillus sp. LZ02]|uniref:phage tail protein n=1 Tax=Lysinibacillus sp. LZ02 TaxID=3420668 RepID=UPI003D368116